MSEQTDKTGPLVVGFSLGATGYLANPQGGGTPAYAIIDMIGCNHLSFTAQIVSGSSPSGTLTFECTDFGYPQDQFQNTWWAPLNQPNTTTQYSITVAAVTNYNIQIPNIGCKYVRVKYNFTSGSGTLNAAVTCRANGR